MKKIAEKEVYIIQIIVYLLTMAVFIIVKDESLRYIALFSAVAISVVLTMFNIFVLGKRNTRKKIDSKKN